MSIIKSYAAKNAGAELEVWEYDAGELLPEDVEVKVDYCGIMEIEFIPEFVSWRLLRFNQLVNPTG